MSRLSIEEWNKKFPPIYEVFVCDDIFGPSPMQDYIMKVHKESMKFNNLQDAVNYINNKCNSSITTSELKDGISIENGWIYEKHINNKYIVASMG